VKLAEANLWNAKQDLQKHHARCFLSHKKHSPFNLNELFLVKLSLSLFFFARLRFHHQECRKKFPISCETIKFMHNRRSEGSKEALQPLNEILFSIICD